MRAVGPKSVFGTPCIFLKTQVDPWPLPIQLNHDPITSNNIQVECRPKNDIIKQLSNVFWV